DSVSGQFFNKCINQAVPSWKNIPFYKATVSDRKLYLKKGMRAWQDEDIRKVILNSDSWQMYFHEREVLQILEKCDNETIGSENRADSLFYRILWLDSLDKHLKRLNDEIASV